LNRYTGNRDGDAGKCREGTKEFIKHAIYLSEGALWNNGDYANRPVRGGEALSVHATGRAVDLSYRKMPKKGIRGGRKMGAHMAEFFARHANELGIECVLDYWPAPHGRGFRWDRGKWLEYDSPTIHGAPKGDWLHVELAPAWADSAEKVRRSFAGVFPPSS
jgi:hypothetical protein